MQFRFVLLSIEVEGISKEEHFGIGEHEQLLIEFIGIRLIERGKLLECKLYLVN